MIFNGTDLSSRLIIRKKIRSMSPDIGITSINTPQKAGSHFVRHNIGTRTIDVDFIIAKNSRSDLLDEIRAISAILTTDEPKTLKFKDDNVQYVAILSGATDIDEIRYWGQGRLSFFCADPFKYATTETVLTAPATVTQDGQPTPCQIELTLAEASTYIQVGIGSDVIRFEQDFEIGDVVKIDTGKRTAILNDTVDIRPKKTITSDWILAQTGAVSKYPASSTLKVTYRKRWL